MTYQPYPTGGGSNQMAARPGEQPTSLRTAVRLMWAGAAISLIGVIITLSFGGRIKTAIRNAAVTANKTAAREHKAQLTAADIHTLANATFAILVFVGIIGVLLWAWMAWANNKGSSWARIVATVLFALNTLSLIFEVGRASVSLIAIVVEWLVGLGAIFMLWRRETTQYINFSRQR